MTSFTWKKRKTACQASPIGSTVSKIQKYRRVNSKTLCNIANITFKVTRVSGALLFYYANIKVMRKAITNAACTIIHWLDDHWWQDNCHLANGKLLFWRNQVPFSSIVDRCLETVCFLSYPPLPYCVLAVNRGDFFSDMCTRWSWTRK